MFREFDILFTKWGAVLTSAVAFIATGVGFAYDVGCLKLFFLPMLVFGLIGFIKVKEDADELRFQREEAEALEDDEDDPTGFYALEPPRKSPESSGLFVPDPLTNG